MFNKIDNENLSEKITQLVNEYISTQDFKEKEFIKTKIVVEMIPIVKRITRRIARRSYDPIEDMEQAGYIGLLKAIESYEKKKNDNFKAYATYLVIGEIKHYLRDRLNTIRVPRHVQELIIRINNFTKELTLEEIEYLTNEDLAIAVSAPVSAINVARQIERRQTTLSLDNLYIASESHSLNYEEILPSGDYKADSEYEDAKIIINNVIKKLPQEEQVIIDMYYNQDMTKKEIADALVISPMSVTRRMKQAFNNMSSLILDDTEKAKIDKGNLNTEDE